MAYKYNVLHVEDEPIYIEVFEHFIKTLDVDYEAALSVEEAFDCLEKRQPHLLIVDLALLPDELEDISGDQLKTISGINFIKNVAKKYPKLKMMVLTAIDDPKYKKKLQNYVVHYENKSFRPSILKEKIQTILEGSLEGNET